MQQSLDELSKWLHSPEYGAGVVLYQRLIGEGFLLDYLKAGSDDYRRKRLTDALQLKHDELAAEHSQQQQAYPQTLKNDLGRGGQLMDERIALKERMRALIDGGTLDGDDLREKAFRVLAIKDELDGIFGRQQFYDQNGYLPDPSAPTDASPADLVKRRNTLRTYVSRLPKQIEEAYEADLLAKLKTRLETYQTELFEIEQQLQLQP